MTRAPSCGQTSCSDQYASACSRQDVVFEFLRFSRPACSGAAVRQASWCGLRGRRHGFWVIRLLKRLDTRHRTCKTLLLPPLDKTCTLYVPRSVRCGGFGPSGSCACLFRGVIYRCFDDGLTRACEEAFPLWDGFFVVENRYAARPARHESLAHSLPGAARPLSIQAKGGFPCPVLPEVRHWTGFFYALFPRFSFRYTVRYITAKQAVPPSTLLMGSAQKTP